MTGKTHKGNGHEIIFTDTEDNLLFSVQDGSYIVLTNLDGQQETLHCEYINDAYARIGGDVCQVRDFIKLQERRSVIYAPEHPGEGDVCDSYAIYQIVDTRNVEYSFCSYQAAKERLQSEDYRKVYIGVLAPNVTLEDLYVRHNQDDRPFGQKIRSLSMSDIFVLNRGGKAKAYYVDFVGFQEVKAFLKPRQALAKDRAEKGENSRKRGISR